MLGTELWVMYLALNQRNWAEGLLRANLLRVILHTAILIQIKCRSLDAIVRASSVKRMQSTVPFRVLWS